MENLIQVLFFAVVILASVFDAAARKKKRGQSVPEEYTGEEWPTSEESSPGEVGTSTERPRETADSMVPADLWAILTGQPLPPPTPDPTSRPEPTTGRQAEPADAATWEAGERQEAKSAERRWEDAVREPVRPEHVEPVRLERAAPIHRPMPVRSGGENAPRRPVARMAALPGERAMVASSGPAPNAAQRRRARSAGPIDLSDPGELRRAVILTEILGQPIALRPRSVPWEER